MSKDTAYDIRGQKIDLKRMITFRLARLQAKLNAQATRILKKNGDLTLMQWRVLVLLDIWGEANLALMVRETDFDKALLSRTVKAMISKGLVSSKTSESDLRQHLLNMTDKGRAAFDLALPLMRGRQEQLLRFLDEQQRADLFAAFETIEATLLNMEEPA